MSSSSEGTSLVPDEKQFDVEKLPHIQPGLIIVTLLTTFNMENISVFIDNHFIFVNSLTNVILLFVSIVAHSHRQGW